MSCKVPADYRRALGLNEGEDVVISLEDESLRVMSAGPALERARLVFESLRSTAGESVVEELLAESKAEVARENTK